MNEKNNIPKHWQVKRLGEVCSKIVDGSHNPPKSENQGLPMLSAKDIFNNKIIFDEPRWIKHDEFEREDKRTNITSGDILLTIVATIGRTAVVPVRYPKFTLQRSVAVLKTKQNPYFVCYAFQTHNFQQQLRDKAKGTAQKGVYLKTLSQLEIPIPPLPEQQDIVSKIEELFSDLEKGKQQLQTAQQQLKVYKQSLLKAAFEGKLTNKEIEDGELPKGWQVVHITDITEKNKHALKAGPFGSSLKKEFYVKEGYKVYGQEQVISDNANLGDYYINEDKYQELSSCKIEPFDVLISLVGTVGKVLILPENCKPGIINPRLIKITLNRNLYLPKFFKYYFESSYVKTLYTVRTQGTTMDVLNLGIIKTIPFPLPPIKEQQLIVSELESKLTFCDKIEETITQSLQQAETLRQSILKKAFEGKLVVMPEELPVYKPKNVYFYQMQVLGLIAKASKQKEIHHGEMTIAKYAYLIDKIYNIPTYYKFERFHLGPYPPEIKKAINNKKFFKVEEHCIELKDEETLFKYANPNKEKINEAVKDLSEIFSKYDQKTRSHKTELLATVCKVIEDIQSIDLEAVRHSMKDWKINLPNTKFKNKAEKFSEEETEKCLQFIREKEWEKRLIM